MMVTTHHAYRTLLTVSVLCWLPGIAFAQEQHGSLAFDELPEATGTIDPSLYSSPVDREITVAASCSPNCGGCNAAGCLAARGFFGGADFLLVRPHFSEAMAFARGAAGPGSLRTAAEPLDFDYDGSLRAFLGYRGGNGEGELRFTYWHMQGDTAVGAGTPGPGEFVVDPFGNLFGIDPTGGAAPFYQPDGDSIATRASVDLNIFDIDMATSVCLKNPSWKLDVLAGVRIVDVDQAYDSVVRDDADNVLSAGDYSVDFSGAGPRLGAGLRRVFGRKRQFAAYANGAGSLLLGTYDVAFNTTAGQFQGGQSEQMTRLIPVVDMEVGGAWQCSDHLTLAGGWMNQAWFDLGTSGGSFSGLFTGADDSNIMSFDGMFLRAELAF